MKKSKKKDGEFCITCEHVEVNNNETFCIKHKRQTSDFKTCSNWASWVRYYNWDKEETARIENKNW